MKVDGTSNSNLYYSLLQAKYSNSSSSTASTDESAYDSSGLKQLSQNSYSAVLDSAQSGQATEQSVATDFLDLSGQETISQAATYSISKNTYTNIQDTVKYQVQTFKLTMSQQILGQLSSSASSSSSDIFSSLSSMSSSAEEIMASITDALEAKEASDVDLQGYWSVEETSARILDFAKELAGEDSSRIQLLRDAFEEGYSQAMEAYGQEEPEISASTREAVLQGFDDWLSGLTQDSEDISVQDDNSQTVS